MRQIFIKSALKLVTVIKASFTFSRLFELVLGAFSKTVPG